MFKKRSMKANAAAVFIILILLFPFTVSFGDAKAVVTVQNRTPYYLHVIMNDKPYLYVRPFGEARQESGHVLVHVFYSPGQGISGSASKTIDAVRVVGGSYESTGFGCGSGPTTHSGPTTWAVTLSDLGSQFE
jgi:hypothetical protein